MAERITTGSREIPRAAWERLTGHFSRGEILEIVSVAGLFNYLNRFNNALRMPPTEPSPYLER